jgi:hypothetical protein
MYAVLNRSQSAIYHAKRCLEVCEQNSIADWGIAFAYEAMARAHAVAGQKADCKKYIELADKVAGQIREKSDGDYLISELRTINL